MVISLTTEEIAIALGKPEELDIVFRFSPCANDNITGHDDIADEYIVTRCKNACSNLIVWGRYGNRWIANPSERPVIRQLLRNLGISV